MDKYLKCTTDKNPLSYRCGEKMIFTVQAREKCQPIAYELLKWTLATDDGKKAEGIYHYDNGKPLVLETSLERPGFARLTVNAYGRDGSEITDLLEAGAGAEIEKLSYLDEIPEDFDAYWEKIEKAIAEHEPRLLYERELTLGVPSGFRAFDIRISAPYEGLPASAILTLPIAEGKYPLEISYNGYSICGAAAVYKEKTICLRVNAHGIENDLLSVEAEEKHKELRGYGFDREENSSPETTYWRGMMIRDLVAVRYAKSLPAWDGKGLTVWGGSQGALQATTVAAHDKDVTYLLINVPWFCNLKAEAHGYMGGWRPKPDEGLRYFDTIAQATRVCCPVEINLRLGDYICPPSTTVALYNSFRTVKAMNAMQAGTHSYIPHEQNIFRLRSDPENPTGELKLGKYRHYKGGEYEVLFIGKDSETLEQTVVYRSLSGGGVWVRPKWMFEEYANIKGIPTKRFTYIG